MSALHVADGGRQLQAGGATHQRGSRIGSLSHVRGIQALRSDAHARPVSPWDGTPVVVVPLRLLVLWPRRIDDCGELGLFLRQSEDLAAEGFALVAERFALGPSFVA